MSNSGTLVELVVKMILQHKENEFSFLLIVCSIIRADCVSNMFMI